jgi:hypothetical protein
MTTMSNSSRAYWHDISIILFSGNMLAGFLLSIMQLEKITLYCKPK